jgi:hypothetical protein
MDLPSIGRIMLVLGIIIAVCGGLLMLLGNLPFFRNLGNLPGDIRIQGEGFSCFIPIVSMIIISIVLTVLLNIIIRFINK